MEAKYKPSKYSERQYILYDVTDVIKNYSDDHETADSETHKSAGPQSPKQQ